MESVAKQRDASFDIAKGIAIYLVVLGHVVTASALRIPIDFVHMPVFFFISGWFFARRFRSADEDEGAQIKLKAKRLLIPFLIWSFIALVFNVLLQVRAGEAFTQAFAVQFVDIFFHARSLWFLLVLFLLFCYMFLCRFLARKVPLNRYVLAIAGWVLLYVFFPDSEAASVLRLFKFEWLFPVFLVGAAVGGNTRLSQQAKALYRGHKVLVSLALVACFVLMYLFYDAGLFELWGVPNVFGWSSPLAFLQLLGYYVLSLGGVLAIILLSGWLSRTPVARPLEAAGTYSLDVYVMHMFLVSAYKLAIPAGVADSSLVTFGIAPLFSLVAVAAIVVLAHKVLDRIPLYRALMRG